MPLVVSKHEKRAAPFSLGPSLAKTVCLVRRTKTTTSRSGAEKCAPLKHLLQPTWSFQLFSCCFARTKRKTRFRFFLLFSLFFRFSLWDLFDGRSRLAVDRLCCGNWRERGAQRKERRVVCVSRKKKKVGGLNRRDAHFFFPPRHRRRPWPGRFQAASAPPPNSDLRAFSRHSATAVW